MYEITPVTSKRSTDCGACSLKMLLSFYGVDVDIETLIKECNVNLIGSTAKDLMLTGRKYGLEMAAFKADVEDVIKQDRPAICWWMYNHWLVFCGLDEEGKVVLCNPSRGKYRVSQGQFKSLYTGVELANGEPEDLPE